MKLNKLLELAIKASLEAGDYILKVYNTDFEIEHKTDKSPLTKADKGAHEIINNFLKETNISVLSEEGEIIEYEDRCNLEYLWIVDPLDGTKEFVKRNGEFTVNIALINKNTPVLGIIYVPVLKQLYFANKEIGSFKLDDITILPDYNINLEALMQLSQKLPIHNSRENITVVSSRTHTNSKTEEFIANLNSKYKNLKIVSKGSSLKLCIVAEGEADIYPRFGPTMEWDVAAGHAIVKYMGGKVTYTDSDLEIIYNKKDLLNPWFICKK